MNRLGVLLLVLFAIFVDEGRAQQTGDGKETAKAGLTELLKGQGIAKAKGKYVLVSEDEAFRLYAQSIEAMEQANQAIAMAGESVFRNQAIIDFQQRIAFDAGLAAQMGVERRGGTTLDEQTTQRASKRDIAIAKQQRALMGLEGARVDPRQAESLANNAEKACRKAAKSRQDLVDALLDIDDKYRKLAADSQLKRMIGSARLEPSDRFKKLAASIGLTKKRKGSKPPSAEELATRRSKAIEELNMAANQLRQIAFPGNPERNRIRLETIEEIEQAIARLKKGEMERRMLAKALELSEGYTGGMTQDRRDALDQSARRVERAVAIIRGQ